jgi:hypothetical protein
MHGGSAWAATAPSRGAELHLRLPVLSETGDGGRPEATAAPLAT